jgi:A/G-specific adenine glycosylase
MTIDLETIKRKHEINISIKNWSIVNLREFPWRKDRTPYKILIAEFMLRRTTASAVKRIFPNFIVNYPTLKDISNADIKDLEKHFKTLGYQKQRSKMIKETSEFILKEYNGDIPNNIDALKRIPNIGPYIAGAILSLGYGIKATMIDSNVDRVISRVFFSYISEKNEKKKISNIVEILIPEIDHQIFNLTLIDLGGTICTYRKTDHEKCPLKNYCDYYDLKSQY